MENIQLLHPSRKHIVIIGAGFGGITAALKLGKKLRRNNQYAIVLVDRNPYQLYTPALYEIAAIPREQSSAYALKSAIAIPIEDIVAKRPIKFIQDEMMGIDRVKKEVLFRENTPLPYQFLVLALGSETNYFDIPGLQSYSYSLKKFEDAVRIRNRIEELLKERRALTVIVGGGGATGVELIAEFSNFICILQKKILPDHPLCNIHLILVEAAEDILPGFNPWFVEHAKKRLHSLGITVKTNTAIASVTPQELLLKNGPPIRYDLLIWTGGVGGSSLLAHLHLPLTQKRNVAVNEFLEIDQGIYAIGDNAGFTDPRTKKLLIWNVPVAEAEAKLAVKNILRDIRGQKKIPFRPLTRYPFILAVGKTYAIADLLFIRISGTLGWCLKLLVELRYLLFILPLARALRLWWEGVRLYRSNDA